MIYIHEEGIQLPRRNKHEKYRKPSYKYEKQTIGVEVEMNSITRKKAAILVGEYFGTRAYDAAREYGYFSWACKDTKGRT